MDLEIEIDQNAITVLDGAYTEEGRVTEPGIAFARAVLAMAETAKSVVADKFLNTYNDTWSGGGHPKLTREQFVDKLSLSRIELFDEEGAAMIHYADGDMFGGHWLSVFVDNGQPATASMRG